MAKKFKAHYMYKGKSAIMAKTYAKHLELKKKGYGHTKPGSPLKINQALIENYKGVNKYTRQGGGTRAPEFDVESAKTGALDIISKSRKNNLGVIDKDENQTDADRMKALEAQIAKLQKERNQQNNNEDPADDTPADDTPEGNEEVETNTPPSKEEKKVIADKVEEEFNQYPEDVQSKPFDIANTSKPLTLEQETLAGNAKPSKLRVRSVYDKGRRNDNVVEVNGQRMTNQEFADGYPGATRIRGGENKGSNVAAGDYNFSGSLEGSPAKMRMQGNSPFKQTAQDYDPLAELQMQNPNIERDVDTYIENTSLVGDEKLDILGAQANARVYDFSKQLKNQANMYIEQEGNSKIVNDSINTLRGLAQKVNNLVDKKAEWIENNGGGESGKRGFSKGSSGKNKFMQNAIFTERDDLYKMILPLPEQTVSGDSKFGDVEFAFGNFQDSSQPNVVVKSSEIFKNVFMKPEGKFADFRKAAVKQAENSRDRKAFNAYHAEVVVNGLLDSKENILAFAWDDFAGPSFIDQYAEARPGEDLGWADVDNPKFNEDRLKKEVGYWLNQKLKTEHEMTKANDKAFSYLNKMSPDELIAKYSK